MWSTVKKCKHIVYVGETETMLKDWIQNHLSDIRTCIHVRSYLYMLNEDIFNLLMLRVPDEGYFRNTSGTLNLISTFLLNPYVLCLNISTSYFFYFYDILVVIVLLWISREI